MSIGLESRMNGITAITAGERHRSRNSSTPKVFPYISELCRPKVVASRTDESIPSGAPSFESLSLWCEEALVDCPQTPGDSACRPLWADWPGPDLEYGTQGGHQRFSCSGGSSGGIGGNGFIDEDFEMSSRSGGELLQAMHRGIISSTTMWGALHDDLCHRVIFLARI